MEQLLDFNAPFNVGLLDQIVNCVYQSKSAQEIQAAQKVLTQFQQHPMAWTRASIILEQSTTQHAKYFALQVLQETIRYKWNALPEDQRLGIKNYIVRSVIEKSSNSDTLANERVLIGKMNEVLIQIVKNEWPHNWKTFIPEIVNSGKSSESLCENNMNILQLLSEEVFDFSSGTLVQHKVEEMRLKFKEDFQLIYQLCDFVLHSATRPSLILATLKTLLKFLAWLPANFVFGSSMVELLVTKFFPTPQFRNAALRCLVEIAGFDTHEFDAKLGQMFIHFMGSLTNILPPNTNIPVAYEKSSDYDQKFIEVLALFLCTLFKNHLKAMETMAREQVVTAHMHLVEISKIDDTELFKTCLEYWNFLAQDLYFEEKQTLQHQQQQHMALGGFYAETPASMRKSIYESEMSGVNGIMPRVRLVMISKMAKPEEVIIVEDENGQIIKEYMKDVDAIQLYKTMRDTLIYLTNLNYIDTERIMLEKLTAQVNGTEWSWHNLNTLCWAIGSISGAMNAKIEKRFLVAVIRDLLRLCELKRGKDNKAVVASNIMYVVGQYPRFLIDHWRFLKTVVNKLFEFMHETFAGVQEMACDTFLKISKQCRKQFVAPQEAERPFIEDILEELLQHICHLEAQHIHVFYEAVGYMISAAPEEHKERLVLSLMNLPNSKWSEIMQGASRSVDYLKNTDNMKQLATLLKTNVSVASSVGNAYMYQMRHIFSGMLDVYKLYSQFISQEVTDRGVIATKHSHVRSMRAVKKETLKLMETLVNNSTDGRTVLNNFVQPLIQVVIDDYKNSVPDAKDPGVLTLLAAVLEKLKDPISADPTTVDIPKFVLENVLDCTLPMITKNFEDFPEHRTNLFHLLRTINKNCFPAFFKISPQGFRLVLDSVLWAIRHDHRNIYKTGLHIMKELLVNIEQLNNPSIITGFYKTYFFRILNDIMSVLMDTMHKAGFKLQSEILFDMFSIIRNNRITEPVFDRAQFPAVQSNEEYIKRNIADLISKSFPNLTAQQVIDYVQGLFDKTANPELFKQHLRDFLVIQKEFGASDNSDLYHEERKRQERERLDKLAQVPGLLKEEGTSSGAKNNKHGDSPTQLS